LDDYDDPRWIGSWSAAIAAAIAAVGSVSLTLAVLGSYRWPLVLAAGSVLFVVVSGATGPARSARRGEVTRCSPPSRRGHNGWEHPERV